MSHFTKEEKKHIMFIALTLYDFKEQVFMVFVICFLYIDAFMHSFEIDSSFVWHTLIWNNKINDIKLPQRCKVIMTDIYKYILTYININLTKKSWNNFLSNLSLFYHKYTFMFEPYSIKWWNIKKTSQYLFFSEINCVFKILFL